MSHVTSESAPEALMAEPGALVARREVMVTSEHNRAVARAQTPQVLFQVARSVAYEIPRDVMRELPHGVRAVGITTVLGLLVAFIVSFFIDGWTPWIVGLLLYPLAVVLGAVAASLLSLRPAAKGILRWRRGEDGPLETGPTIVEVYEHAVVVTQPSSQFSISAITSVRQERDVLQVTITAGSSSARVSYPSTLIAEQDVRGLVGGPLVVFPGDGGPSAYSDTAWLEAQCRAMPGDAAGANLRSDLRHLRGRSPLGDAGVAVESRYDATSNQLVLPRTRQRFAVERVVARGEVVCVGYVRPPGSIIVPLASFASSDVRALIDGLDPSRCDVDIVLDGERVVRNAWAFEPGGEGGPRDRVDMADPAALEAHVREAQRRAIARARGEDVESAHHPDAEGPAAAVAEARPQPRNGRATTALLLSIVGLPFIFVALFALFQGYKARREIRNAAVPLRGMRRANVAIVLGWIGALWPLAYGIWLALRG